MDQLLAFKRNSFFADECLISNPMNQVFCPRIGKHFPLDNEGFFGRYGTLWCDILECGGLLPPLWNPHGRCQYSCLDSQGSRRASFQADRLPSRQVPGIKRPAPTVFSGAARAARYVFLCRSLLRVSNFQPFWSAAAFCRRFGIPTVGVSILA
jgi:hypothetical protein